MRFEHWHHGHAVGIKPATNPQGLSLGFYCTTHHLAVPQLLTFFLGTEMQNPPSGEAASQLTSRIEIF